MSLKEDLTLHIDGIVKAVIGSGALEGGGKKNPKKLPASGVMPKKKEEEDLEEEEEETSKEVVAEIVKADSEKQIILGIVLEPETVDAQGDIYSAAVIEDTAHRYLSEYNKKTRLGLQHKSFKPATSETRFSIVESYIAPVECAIGDKTVKAGTWIMGVKVHDAAIWKAVKEGKITGFSIGGMSKTQKL